MTYFKPLRRKIGVLRIAKCCACVLASFILCDLVWHLLRDRVRPEPLTLLQFIITAVACIAMSGAILVARANDFIAILFTTVMTVGGAILAFACLSIPILGALYQYDHGYGEYDRSVLISVIIGANAGAVIASFITAWIRKSPISAVPKI